MCAWRAEEGINWRRFALLCVVSLVVLEWEVERTKGSALVFRVADFFEYDASLVCFDRAGIPRYVGLHVWRPSI